MGSAILILPSLPVSTACSGHFEAVLRGFVFVSDLSQRARPTITITVLPVTNTIFSHAFSTLQTNAFASCIETFGSATRDVSSLTTSPVDSPSYPQCQGMPTWCTTLPSIVNGRIRRVPELWHELVRADSKY